MIKQLVKCNIKFESPAEEPGKQYDKVAQLETKLLTIEKEKETLIREMTELRKNSLEVKVSALSFEELEELDSKCDKLQRLIKERMVKKDMSLFLKFQKEYRQCPICLDKTSNIFFNCGHRSCDQCAKELKTCPMCRVAIKDKMKIY